MASGMTSPSADPSVFGPPSTLDEIDAVEPVSELLYGWRALALVPEAADPLLKGVLVNWRGPEMVAQCSVGSAVPADFKARAREHLYNDTHKCGIHALKEISNEQLDYPVIALCVLDGIVLEGELGYRAERVRMEQLWWNPAAAGQFTPDDVSYILAFERLGLPWKLGLPPIGAVEDEALHNYKRLERKLTDYGHWKDHRKAQNLKAGKAYAATALKASFATHDSRTGNPATLSRGGPRTDKDFLHLIMREAGCATRVCLIQTDRRIETRDTRIVHVDGLLSDRNLKYEEFAISDRSVHEDTDRTLARIVAAIQAQHAATDLRFVGKEAPKKELERFYNDYGYPLTSGDLSSVQSAPEMASYTMDSLRATSRRALKNAYKRP